MTKYQLYNLRRRTFIETILLKFPNANVQCLGKHAMNNNCLMFNISFKMEGKYIELYRKLKDLNYSLSLFYGVREDILTLKHYKKDWNRYTATGKNWAAFTVTAAFPAIYCE